MIRGDHLWEGHQIGIFTISVCVGGLGRSSLDCRDHWGALSGVCNATHSGDSKAIYLTTLDGPVVAHGSCASNPKGQV